jgi:hypothetical protein
VIGVALFKKVQPSASVLKVLAICASVAIMRKLNRIEKNVFMD